MDAYLAEQDYMLIVHCMYTFCRNVEGGGGGGGTKYVHDGHVIILCTLWQIHLKLTFPIGKEESPLVHCVGYLHKDRWM